MDDVVAEDEILETESVPLYDQIIQELEGLPKYSPTGEPKNVVVEDIPPKIIESFNETEAIMFLAGIQIAPIAGRIYDSYIFSKDYTTWPPFWETQRDDVDEIVSILTTASDAIPDTPDYIDLKQYLLLLAIDWEMGASRKDALSEVWWYALTHEACKVDIRGLPRTEYEAEAYTYQTLFRPDGGDTLWGVRIVEEAPDQTEFGIIEKGILDISDTRDIRAKYFIEIVQHFLAVRAGLHGRNVAPTGSQYKRKSENLIRVISNRNIKERNKREFEVILDQYFAGDALADVLGEVKSSAIGGLFGHEIAEAMLEDKFEGRPEVLGGRSIIEFLADMTTMAGLIRQPGEEAQEIVSHIIKNYVAGCVRLQLKAKADPTDNKLGIYLYGYNTAMERLEEGRGIVYDDEHKKIIAINIPEARQVILDLFTEGIGVLTAGTIEDRNKLFELKKAA